MLTFTVIGRYGPYAQPGGATSCYLVRAGEDAVVADMGAGALGRLLKFLPLERVSAVVLTHLHADHMSDMLTARYYCSMSPSFADRKLKVYLPFDGSAEFGLLSSCPKFELCDIAGLKGVCVGGITLTSYEMTHPMKAYAVNFAHKGRSLTYSGDTTLNPNIALSISGANAFLCDCANASGDPTSPHIAVSDAARLAAAEKVKFYCTHFSDADEAPALAAARAAGADAEAVQELKTYAV